MDGMIQWTVALRRFHFSLPVPYTRNDTSSEYIRYVHIWFRLELRLYQHLFQKMAEVLLYPLLVLTNSAKNSFSSIYIQVRSKDKRPLPYNNFPSAVHRKRKKKKKYLVMTPRRKRRTYVCTGVGRRSTSCRVRSAWSRGRRACSCSRTCRTPPSCRCDAWRCSCRSLGPRGCRTAPLREEAGGWSRLGDSVEEVSCCSVTRNKNIFLFLSKRDERNDT